MIIPDANLILYAYDEESPWNSDALAWWESLLSGDEEVGLCSVVVFAFVRIATHAKVFDKPLRIGETVEIVRSWLDAVPVRLIESSAEDCLCAIQLLEQAGVGGNLTTDAQIAALALRLKATIHTADTDFARFGVRWKNPLV